MIEWITYVLKAWWDAFATCPMLTFLYTAGAIFFIWFILDLHNADTNPKKTEADQ